MQGVPFCSNSNCKSVRFEHFLANPRGDPFRGTLGHLKIDLKSELDFEHFVAKPKGNPFDLQIDPEIDPKIDPLLHLKIRPENLTWKSRGIALGKMFIYRN